MIKHDKSQRTKFRSFLIIYHTEYGFLLLEAYKAKKGKHYQLAGGHVDKDELHTQGLMIASKIAAIRELYEETGLNFGTSDELKSRLERLDLGIENRMYYRLIITNNDSVHLQDPKYRNIQNIQRSQNQSENEKIQENSDEKKNSNVNEKINNTMNEVNEKAKQKLLEMRGLSLADVNEHTMNKNEKFNDFYLKLSHEHTGFTFVQDINNARDMVKLHSGGKNSDALKVYAKMYGFKKSKNKNKNKNKKSKKDKKNKKDKRKQSESKSLSKSKSKSASQTQSKSNDTHTIHV